MADETQGQAEHETIAGPDGQTPPRGQLRIDDSGITPQYASICRVAGTAEDITIDFAHGIRPGGQPNSALLKIEHRVTMSPWAAKRLALALGQAVQRYEQVYGELEIDPRKRAQQPVQS